MRGHLRDPLRRALPRAPGSPRSPPGASTPRMRRVSGAGGAAPVRDDHEVAPPQPRSAEHVPHPRVAGLERLEQAAASISSPAGASTTKWRERCVGGRPDLPRDGAHGGSSPPAPASRLPMRTAREAARRGRSVPRTPVDAIDRAHLQPRAAAADVGRVDGRARRRAVAAAPRCAPPPRRRCAAARSRWRRRPSASPAWSARERRASRRSSARRVPLRRAWSPARRARPWPARYRLARAAAAGEEGDRDEGGGRGRARGAHGLNGSPGSAGASRPESQRSTEAPTSASGPSWRRPPWPSKRASSGACSRVWSEPGVVGSQPWSAVRTSRSRAGVEALEPAADRGVDHPQRLVEARDVAAVAVDLVGLDEVGEHEAAVELVHQRVDRARSPPRWSRPGARGRRRRPRRPA